MKDKLEKLVAGAAEINRQLEKLHELHYASLWKWRILASAPT